MQQVTDRQCIETLARDPRSNHGAAPCRMSLTQHEHVSKAENRERLPVPTTHTPFPHSALDLHTNIPPNSEDPRAIIGSNGREIFPTRGAIRSPHEYRQRDSLTLQVTGCLQMAARTLLQRLAHGGIRNGGSNRNFRMIPGYKVVIR